ncbi:hypothetical protein PFISCL1PPCAC_12083, partial [Pristionchus fissidentatus]
LFSALLLAFVRHPAAAVDTQALRERSKAYYPNTLAFAPHEYEGLKANLPPTYYAAWANGVLCELYSKTLNGQLLADVFSGAISAEDRDAFHKDDGHRPCKTNNERISYPNDYEFESCGKKKTTPAHASAKYIRNSYLREFKQRDCAPAALAKVQAAGWKKLGQYYNLTGLRKWREMEGLQKLHENHRMSVHYIAQSTWPPEREQSGKFLCDALN